ncbi:hypothetical protein D1007_15311 [Hordeum vulgare]|nr:hypothetical protein D1007_15311 [Hordeum vulgare]KAI4982438.1 hypothetical protein ZWY2020_022930 [Hordeum vulgare]
MSTSSPASGAASPEGEGAGGRKYKGVRRRKWGKWVSEIRLPNSRERIWLGSYDAPDKAARAFDAAFVCLRGPGAAGADLNFPDSPPPPCRHSVDPQEVQAAALSHANRAAVSAREDDCSRAPAALSTEQWSVTQPSWAQHDTGMDIFGDDAADDGSVDWRSVMAHQPPLFSPTAGWGSNAYDFLQVTPPPPQCDEDMEECGHGASASLWSFDSRDSYFRY